MHFEFLVEELSAEETLKNILPRILGENFSYDIHPFQGKHDLLKNLTNRLRGYIDRLNNCSLEELRIVVLIDKHTDDCLDLKHKLKQQTQNAKFDGKSGTIGGKRFHILLRIVVEELEAWFFGDMEALNKAYPSISINLGRKAKYRNPDAMTYPSRILEKDLIRTGYYRQRASKTEVARMISPHMLPNRNRAKSFQVFKDGLIEMLRD